MATITARNRPAINWGKTVVKLVIIVIIGGVLISLTNDIHAGHFLGYFEPHRSRLVTGEVALIGVILVEIVAKAVLRHYERQNARQLGVIMRAVIRTISYIVLGVVILSILASNPAMAVSVGSLMGLVVGFSTQNIISNVIAGMFLAIGRPFKIDDEITVMGNTGRVSDFQVLHTMLETADRIVLIPNSTMLSQVILRNPKAGPREFDLH
ncbi:MAG: mechanosensitive ion channel family protein [SAR202 cluster bacterium]|nr:mechanosensitive ion channel family protein [SAR202 cluster bacterium]